MVNKIKLFCTRGELGRAVWHMLTITLALLFFYFSTENGAYLMILIGALLIIFDYGRSRSAYMKKSVPQWLLNFLREDEKDALSGTGHFVLAGLIIFICHVTFGLPKDTILCGVMFVAVGDPMARLVGKNITIMRVIGTRKTLAGSVAFFLAGSMSAIGMCYLVGAKFSIIGVLVGGLVATLIELYSNRWDNFHVPLWTTLVIWGIKVAV